MPSVAILGGGFRRTTRYEGVGAPPWGFAFVTYRGQPVTYRGQPVIVRIVE